ncbi:MAG: hypothetical protein UX62_C0007G0015 [Microgenomates group bacterium GW2011_GWA2_46_7]|nr:MAG: hypothetical protein UX64_C0017G0009 [Microgenomates group bacterium GW2011_GWC2_46_7]KKU46818.1 MAG: hypothetical protein UX62_C0007G0015 [Microgenomates group bacterium GW2011_GWA2_46_7]
MSCQSAQNEALITTLFNAASVVASRMNERNPNPSQQRLGGVMVIAQVGEDPFMVAQKIGDVTGGNHSAPHVLDQHKLDKYAWFAYSKARLLVEKPDLLASSQNTQTPVSEYPALVPGGAVRFGDLILSFSGYSAQDDESIVLATAELAKLEWPGGTLQIATQLGNKRYARDLYYPLLEQEPNLTAEELAQYRTGREYGHGHWTGDGTSLELFYRLLEEKDYLGLAFALGWPEGCSVIPKVIKARGTKEAAQSYAELGSLRGILLDSIRKHYPQITSAFTRPIRRKPGEPNIAAYPNMTGDNDNEVIPPAEKLLSYDFPRLFRAFWGEGDHTKRNPHRFFQGLGIVDQSLRQASKNGWDATEFIVHLAGRFANFDQDPEKYIRRLLSAGKLKDDNQNHAYRKLVRAMRSMHSSLWSTYQHMSADERRTRSIADIAI